MFKTVNYIPEHIYEELEDITIIYLKKDDKVILNKLINLKKLKIRNLTMDYDTLEGLISLEELDLSNNLIKLPKLNSTLKKLDISNNELKTFPDQIRYLHNLEYLDIRGNKFSSYPDWLIELPNLKHISISTWNDQFINLNVKSIYCHSIYKSEYDNIIKLKNIESIDITHNEQIFEEKYKDDAKKIKDLTIYLFNGSLNKNIKYYTNLKKLSLQCNSIYYIDDEFYNLSLEYLDLSNRENKIPVNLNRFTSLKYLNLTSSIQSKDELSIILTIKTLETLIVSNNDFKEMQDIIDTIDNLENLKELNINNCNLRRYPKNLNKLVKLETLKINKNSVNIPDDITNLVNLKYLDISFNKVKTLNNINQLIKLEKLHMESVKIKKLPDTIGLLKNLNIIRANYNDLYELPDSFYNLENLVYMYFNKCKLKNISDQIHKLKNVRIIHMDNNDIEKIPKSIGLLPRLEELYLNYNKLKELPIGLLNIKSLRLISINGNDFKYFPKKYIPKIKDIEINKTYISSYTGRYFPLLKEIIINNNNRCLICNKNINHEYNIKYIPDLKIRTTTCC